jgi:hypothetical protein
MTPNRIYTIRQKKILKSARNLRSTMEEVERKTMWREAGEVTREL